MLFRGLSSSKAIVGRLPAGGRTTEETVSPGSQSVLALSVRAPSACRIEFGWHLQEPGNPLHFGEEQGALLLAKGWSGSTKNKDKLDIQHPGWAHPDGGSDFV